MSSSPTYAAADWRDPEFWSAFQRNESELQRVDARHDAARRALECVDANDASALREAWLAYRAALAELDAGATRAADLRVDTVGRAQWIAAGQSDSG